MLRLITVIGMCAALWACAATDLALPETALEIVPGTVPGIAAEDAAETVEKPPERAIPPDSFYPLLLAEFALRRRHYDVALAQYLEQAHLLNDPGVRSHATHLAQYLRREKEALEAVQLWVQLEPDNVEANHTLATLLTRQGRTLEALPHLAMVGRSGAHAQYPILLTGFKNLDATDRTELVDGVNNLSLEFPEDIQLLVTQALIHEELGQKELALEKIRSVFQREPYQSQAVLLEAKLLLETGAEDPFRRMEEALELNPDDKRLRLQYARMLTRTDIEAARKQFEIMSAREPRDADLLFSLALINRETGDNLAAKAYLRQMLALKEREDEAYYYLGRIAEDEEEPSGAIAYYMEVEDGNDFFSANSRIGRIMLRSNQGAQLHAYLMQLRDKHPEKRAQLFALEADLMTKAGNHQASLAVLNAALEEFPESTALRYSRSMVVEQQDNLQLMESDLRYIIEREPDNATAMNALGYSLANKTERYDEAYELIARALELQPEEPAILDSMGWVLYHLGSYEEAIDYLRRAFVKFPDAEVAAHLGEVLWVSGQQEEALKIWRAAFAKDPEHKILVSTLERLGISSLESP